MKQRLLLFFAVLLNLAAMATDWDGSTASGFGTQTANAGESEANPIIITTPMQWMYAATLTGDNRAKKFALGDDLDFKNMVGAKSFGSLTAGAVFDGKGYTISNIVLSSTTAAQGLFTTVTDATVKNMGLTGTGNITGLSNSGGIVCSAARSTIRNCYNTTSVLGDIVSAQSGNTKAFGIGGIVGSCNASVIEDCYNTGTITGVGRVAGIVGFLSTSHNSFITRCYNTGTISGVYRSGANNYGDCGGILGANVSYTVTIESCYNTGNISVAGISGKNSYVGGIQGTQTPGSSINNCFNTGTVSLDNTNNPTPTSTSAGGITGICGQAVTNCYNTGNVQVVAGPSVNTIGGINGSGSVNIPVNCYTSAGTGYNDVNATTPRIKTLAELQDPAFVAAINNGQNPAKWKADYGTPINGGYPILTYMVSKSQLTDPPTNVIVTVGDTQASVSFTAPVYTGGSAILDYTVIPYIGEVAGTPVTGTSSPIIVTGLSNGTIYTFTITARNTYGSSAPRLAFNPDLVIPNLPSPTLLEATDITSTGFKANWTALSNASGYVVNIYLNDILVKTASVAGQATTSYIFNGNSIGYTYTYKVIALGDNVNNYDSQLPATSISVKTNVGNQIILPKILNSNMVLQQDMQVTLWGWGSANDVINITAGWGATATAIVGADGKWTTKIQTPKAIPGQAPPYTLTFEGANNAIVLSNILIGDVWLCSGQSNMQHAVGQSLDGSTEVAAANYPNIRIITIGRDPQPAVQNNSLSGSWSTCSPSTIASFSAVGYYFGKELATDPNINIPIGLLQADMGASTCEAWIKKETLLADPVLKSTYMDPYVANPLSYSSNQLKPFWLYNGMLAPIIPFAIKGAIWYQGEGNAGKSSTYYQLCSTMIQDWRSLWGVGDFPFYFVQLPYFTSNWALMREAQTNLLTFKNVGMAVTLDVGDLTTIHPINKLPVGRRLSLWAKAKTYGQNIVYSGPIFKSCTPENNKMIINFLPETIGGGLISKDGADLRCFQIAGADNVLYNADATISGNTVIVSSPNVAAPTKVWYAFSTAPDANLTNAEGLPACPFRTDTWDANIVLGLKLFPINTVNSSDIFKVQGMTITTREIGSIQIFDLQGKRLLAAKGVRTLNTNILKGIYIGCYTNENGKSFSEKIIIND